MKNIIITLLLCAVCVTLNAQYFFLDDNLKFGLKAHDGRIIFPGKYDEADTFSQGLAEVELNGKCGFTDTTGKEVNDENLFLVFAHGLKSSTFWKKNILR